MSEGIGRRAARGAIVLAFSSVGTTVIGFAGGIILARLLVPNDFGIVTLAGSVFTFIDIRSKIAVDQRYIQVKETSENSLNELITVSVLLALCSTVVTAFVALIAALFIQAIDVSIALVIASVLGIVDSISNALRIHIEKQLAFRGVALVTTFGFLTQFAVSIVGALAGLGWYSLMLGLALGTLTTLLGFVLLIRPRIRPSFSKRVVRDYVGYGLKYGAPYSISVNVLTWFDNLAVGTLAGTTQLGLYDRAYKTASWPTVLVSAVLQRVTMPAYRQLADFPSRLRDAYSMTLWFLAVTALPIGLAVFAAAPDLVLLVYGPQWLEAAPLLRLLIVFSLTRPLLDDTTAILVATGRSATLTRLLGVEALLLVLLVIPATLAYGALGAAGAVGIVFLAGAAGSLAIAARSFGVDLRSVLAIPAVALFASFVVYFGLINAFDYNSFAMIPRILAKTVTTVLPFFATVLLLDRTSTVAHANLLIRLLRKPDASL